MCRWTCARKRPPARRSARRPSAASRARCRCSTLPRSPCATSTTSPAWTPSWTRARPSVSGACGFGPARPRPDAQPTASVVAGEGMSGMASAVKRSEHEQFARSVGNVASAVQGLVECTAQSAYLVSSHLNSSFDIRLKAVGQSPYWGHIYLHIISISISISEVSKTLSSDMYHNSRAMKLHIVL